MNGSETGSTDSQYGRDFHPISTARILLEEILAGEVT
jgi:hypothetical protein